MTLHFCRGGLNIRGEHFGCDWPTDEQGHHTGWAHTNMMAQAIWANDPLDVRIATDIEPRLIEALRWLGDEYGPLGVALAAANLTDVATLMSRIGASTSHEPIDTEGDLP